MYSEPHVTALMSPIPDLQAVTVVSLWRSCCHFQARGHLQPMIRIGDSVQQSGCWPHAMRHEVHRTILVVICIRHGECQFIVREHCVKVRFQRQRALIRIAPKSVQIVWIEIENAWVICIQGCSRSDEQIQPSIILRIKPN